MMAHNQFDLHEKWLSIRSIFMYIRGACYGTDFDR